MPRLFEFVGRVRRLSRREFAVTNPFPFLVLHRPPAKGAEWTFKTQTLSEISADIVRLAEAEAVSLSPQLAEYDVFPVVKTTKNPWPERICVGRARNNDIVLGDSSVSKLHAQLEVDPRGSGCLLLTDMGSRNGTRLGGDKLEPGARVSVAVGQTITFGRSTVQVMDAAGLHEMVMAYIGR